MKHTLTAIGMLAYFTGFMFWVRWIASLHLHLWLSILLWYTPILIVTAFFIIFTTRRKK